MENRIYINTGALEIYRWAPSCPLTERPITLNISEWVPQIAAAGFDGIELWEPHAMRCGAAERTAQQKKLAPLAVFNCYVDFGHIPDASARSVAARIGELNSHLVKYTLPRRIPLATAIANLRLWSEELPEETILCNEIHANCYGETPAEAAQLRTLLPEPRWGEIIHLAEPVEKMRALFDVLGDRIRHCHAVFCDTLMPQGELQPCAPGSRNPQLRVLAGLNYQGSFSIEFVRGARWNVVLPEPDAAESLRFAAEDARKIREFTR